MADSTRFTVFSVKEVRSGEQRKTVWVRAGTAWRNRDSSINVFLDVLPLDGKLHLREEGGQQLDKNADGAATASKPDTES